MSDYNKQTVAQLRQMLKDRGIASTGLTRKAQIVERLEEADSGGVENGGGAPAPAEQDASEESQARNSDDAPPGSAEQVEEEEADDVSEGPDVPGPALLEAGGKLTPTIKYCAQG